MTEVKPVILMVEDELDVLRINARIMQRRGFEVLTAASCSEAYKVLEKNVPDLLLLDIMLPDGNGFDICEKFRETSDNPVIFLTGKNEVSDKIDGLEKGGDYYITKPYDLDELMAITQRLIDRHLKAKQKQKELTTVTKGVLTLDIQKAKATVNGTDTGLTTKEFALLLMLIQNEDKEITPNELYEKIWGTPSVDDVRTVRTHIHNLRKKIGADEASDYDIVSTYGKGYTFTTVR